MMEITVTYDDSTRRLSPPDSDRGGTTLDANSTKITVEGLPEGYDARLEFGVTVEVKGSKKKAKPYLLLDDDGSCIIPNSIFRGCKSDLRLPVQLVLTNEDEEYASANILIFKVTKALCAFESVKEAYEPHIGVAIYDVVEEGGVITFYRLDGTTETIHVDDDFVSWKDEVVTAWPAVVTDETVPTTKAVDDTFLKAVQPESERILMTDRYGTVGAIGPMVTAEWSKEPSDDKLPTEKLVRDELDTKALDSEVVHDSRVTDAWTDPPGDMIPTVKAVDDTFLKSKQDAANRILMTDDEGTVGAIGPRITDAWTDPSTNDALPTEKLVKEELDTKAVDAEVVHIDEGTPEWDPTITYHSGSTVVRKLNLYISQNEPNLGHDPTEEETLWWSLVKGDSGQGGDEPGAYKIFKLGDGTSTSFVCNHGFNSYYVGHLLYEREGRMRDSDSIVERISKDHLKITFHTAPSKAEWILVIYRPGLGPESVVTSVNGMVGDIEIDPLALGCLSINEQTLSDVQKAQTRANIDLGTAATRDTGTASGNVPTLGSDGRLPNSVIPPLAIAEWLGTVDTKADLVTLSDAEQGDWAGVSSDSDINNDGVYMLNGTYSDLTSWVQIVGPGSVISVNGKGGVVILKASDVGAVDIATTLNGKTLEGAVVLDADDVGAVTKVDGLTAGEHPVVTYNAQGLVIEGRDLVADDIPGLPGSKITSGEVAIDYLPTGNAADKLVKLSSAGQQGQSLKLNSAGAWEWFTPSSSDLAIFTGTITGDGSTKVFTLTHGLSGTPDPVVFDSTGRKIPGADVSSTDKTITVRFHTAPASGETYTVRGVA